ncbi:hypothetical protein EKO23_16845 [Nocardioides guangzhouensis]|uniref:Uncharacterized protein n=1 Tax=Nocardioides guangzhouensis TaxID=2497878 RepID=A0A4Q4Z8D1_9ACTN|nr:hypothetical protein [Nocardioides guangzhouensis]RYP84137.1 hypothetical protein EKO23_16845 [Nocardioides guangzhouensis]
MTWDAFHHRGDVLRTVTAEVDLRRDGSLPMDLPGVAETFRGELDLLATLQLRWHTRLAGRIERELGDQPLDLDSAVVDAWRATADQMPGVRAVLDRHADGAGDAADRGEAAHVMAVATAKERQMLAVLAGRVSSTEPEPHGQRIGEELEDRARAGWTEPARGRRRVVAVSFLDRLKAALAA